MKYRLLLSAISLIVSSLSHAVQCYITVVTAPCWNAYDVSVDIIDSVSNAKISTVKIPKGTHYGRVNFECKPSQVLAAQATFEPPVWIQDAHKVYNALRFWKLPDEAPQQGAIWSINICFPTQFANLPNSTSADSCNCSLEGVPVVKNTNVIQATQVK